MRARDHYRTQIAHELGGATMQQSRHRRYALAVIAVSAVIGLGATVLPQLATATTPHPRSLGSAVAAATATAALPAGPTPASCVSAAGCDVYASAGTVTAGSVSGTPIWGFTFSSAPDSGELGGSVNNTIIIGQTDALTITLHNNLPAGAGNLSLEIPAAQGLPDAAGAAVGSTASYSFGPFAPGTYVYQAGSTIEQDRQLAMGVAAVIIVRPTGYNASAPTAYAGGLGAFDDEALVVMNEIDPAFNSAPLTSDVEDYNPHFFLINGRVHPLTDDIAANAGDTVLLRAANLGIRDRAVGLVNSRMMLLANDSQKLSETNKVDLETQLLTPGEVADLTTLVDASASVGDQFALLDLDRHINNGGEAGVGGMLTFIDVVGTGATPGAPAATITSLTPATNDGSLTVSVDYTITGAATGANWYLDNLGGTCTGTVPFAAGAHTVALTPATLSAGACGPLWITGDHVLWIQPTGGSASGDSFTLALQGPSVFALSTDPQFTNLTTAYNKVGANPPGDPSVILTGSAQPSLLDYTLDQAEACLSLPGASCPAGDTIPLTLTDPVVPSHVYSLSATIPPSANWPVDGLHALSVRVHESPTAGGAARWSDWGGPNSTVDITIDHSGPSVSNYTASPSPAGVGNFPGNLNFLESVRIQVDIADTASPIADAELFLDTPDADGTGSQLRPLAGQWLDDLTARSRTAYIEVPVSELLSRPQGDVAVFIHGKDAAGNWGPMSQFTLQLDKTNPVILGQPLDAGSHTYLPDETGAPALAGGVISLNACDPNGVTAEPNCPLPSGTALLLPPNTAVTSDIVEIRYHVSAVTGTIGVAGAGIFYQTAQRTLGTVTTNPNGTRHVVFNWNIVPQPPLPIDASTSVWVWVVDGAGNPSVPIEVVLGP